LENLLLKFLIFNYGGGFMGKLRVYELAKELSMESKEVIRRLSKMGFEVKNHMSAVDDKFADALREMVKPNPQKTEYAAKSGDASEFSGDNDSKLINSQQLNNQRGNQQKRQEKLKNIPKQHKKEAKGKTNNLDKSKHPQNKSNYSGIQGKKEKGQKTDQKSSKNDNAPAMHKQVSQKSPDHKDNIYLEHEEKELDFEIGNKSKVKRSKLSAQQTGQKDSFRSGGRKSYYGKKGKKRPQKAEMPPVTPKKVIIGESVTVQELAKSMGKTAAEVIKKLMDLGVLATINKEIDADTAVLIGAEFGIPVEVRMDKTMEIMEDLEEDDERLLIERPPVVTVMGHVDHGKTSLLDAIRKANVTATEAGGITQHIGAYQVEVDGKKITFLDTPGHEAFTAMRARGAQVTDISIIVVAADDGVMPQTVEAINHSKAAKVPIIVAINKIDKPEANPEKVKQELTEYNLVAEEWGGDTIMVPVSAKTQKGIKQLLEMILLVAEMAELKANSKREARGTVIEAELDKGRGPVATVLVQKGTLRIGDNIVAGTTFGKVRALIDDKGRRVKNAGPSTPVVVLGFSDVPPVGEIIEIREDSPTLTLNKIGRHISCLVRTKVVSVLSPWFNNMQVGDIHTIAVSHGEGRFVAPPHVLKTLAEQGQIATQYVDFDGAPSYHISFNPNGSMEAVEAITSPDGRVLGKMGHSERMAPYVAVNVPGEKNQPIFAAGVNYFK
jgi:translation initiation factor IF-2